MYSGVQVGRVKAGVAILLSDRFGQYLQEWRCIDERIVVIQLKMRACGCLWCKYTCPPRTVVMPARMSFLEAARDCWKSGKRRCVDRDGRHEC